MNSSAPPPRPAGPPPGQPGGEPRPGISARRLQTQTRLLDAAATVMAAKGFHGASVEEICDAAGFTRGAFYSNFADKDELLLALLARDRQRFFDAVDLDDVALGLETALERMLSAHAPSVDPYAMQSELTLHALRTPEFAPAVLEADRLFQERIMAVVSEGFARLGLEPVIPLEEVAEVIVALGERSLRNASLTGASDGFALVRRTLPHILRTFTRPVDQSDGASVPARRRPRSG